MQRKTLLRITIALVATPQGNQAAFVGVRRLAEREQLPLGNPRRTGERRVIGEEFEVDGEIEELHGAIPD